MRINNSFNFFYCFDDRDSATFGMIEISGHQGFSLNGIHEPSNFFTGFNLTCLKKYLKVLLSVTDGHDLIMAENCISHHKNRNVVTQCRKSRCGIDNDHTR